MVAHVEDDAPPPPELTLASQCARWRTLPEAGGLYDQDYQMLRLMTAASNVHHALSRLHSLPGKRIHQLTDGERRILRVLVDMGLIFHVYC